MERRRMKAAVLTGPQAIEIKEVPVPVLKPGEIEIKVSACGVCGSDVHMWKAGRGWGGQEGDFHMGHEFCGVVTNPGDSSFKRHRTKLSARSNASADRELLYCYRENVSRETHWRIGQENSLEILFVEDILQAASKAK